jgi:hypothetical protein
MLYYANDDDDMMELHNLIHPYTTINSLPSSPEVNLIKFSLSRTPAGEYISSQSQTTTEIKSTPHFRLSTLAATQNMTVVILLQYES